MSLLQGFRVVQVGSGLAIAVCERLLADAGAEVASIYPAASTPLVDYLDYGKTVGTHEALIAANLIVCDGAAADFRRLNATAAIVVISPFGQAGAKADDPATDLTLFCASGIARMLTGQVDDLTKPLIRPVGEQSAFLGGVAAA